MRLGLCVSVSVEVADSVCRENVAIKTATRNGIPSTPRAGVSLASGSIRDNAAITMRAATDVRYRTRRRQDAQQQRGGRIAIPLQLEWRIAIGIGVTTTR
jgi:hypothetical protein